MYGGLWYLWILVMVLTLWHPSAPRVLKKCAPVYRVRSWRGAQIPGDRSPGRLCVVRWHLNICGSSVYDLLGVTFLASKIFGLFLGFRKFCTPVYTECHRRNGPNFGRVFLMLTYTDITQNTYIQSWTVTEIMAREVWNFDSCYTLTDCQIHIETGRNMWFL